MNRNTLRVVAGGQNALRNQLLQIAIRSPQRLPCETARELQPTARQDGEESGQVRLYLVDGEDSEARSFLFELLDRFEGGDGSR